LAADRLIAKAVTLDPGAVYIKFAKAKIELENAHYDTSRNSVAAILQQHPEYTPAWSLLARVEIEAGNLDAADDAYSRAIDQQPQPFDDLLARALLRISRQQFADADADLQRLEKQGSWRFNLVDDSNVESQRIEMQDSRSVAVAYVRGLLFYMQRQYDEAAVAFENVLGQSNTFMPALLLGGATEFELGRDALAEQKMRKVIEQAPGHLIASRLLAMSRLRLGDGEEAEFVLREALKKSPTDPLALTLLAQALLARGDTAAALESLRQVVELQPESPQARVALADGLRRSNQRSEAETELETAMLFDPGLVSASSGLVSLRLSRGENDSALAAAIDFAKANTESPAAHNLLASTYLHVGEFEAARNSFERALELSPGDTVASQGLATLALRSGQPEVARSHYESALAHHPDDLAALVGLAALEAQAGSEERSIEILQEAIAAHPKELEPRLKLGLVYLMRGRAADVPDVLNPVRKLYPLNVTLLWLLADSARQTEQLNTALELYRDAARLAPNNASLRYAIAKSEAATGDLEHYSESLLAALRLDPMLHPARVDYARELVRNNQLEAAGEQVAWLRQRQIVTPETLLVEGHVLEASGDLAGAGEKYQQIFDAQPNNINLLRLVDIRWKQHDYKDAFDRMNSWLAANPDDPLTQLQLARRYALTSRPGDAIAVLENLIRVHPDNFMALNNLAWLLRDSNPNRALELAQRANTAAPESGQIMDTLSVLLLNHGGKEELRQALQFNRRARVQLPDEPLVTLHTAQLQRAAGDVNGARETLKMLLQEHAEFESRAEAEQMLASLDNTQ
jgi:putative PEP-CTERM system TPR-repeat lipoprotein